MTLPAIILASSSPRRRELLAAAGFKFKIISPRVEEKSDHVLTARELTLFNATQKGISVARLHPENIVLAADTLVALDGKTIGKPANLNQAANVLKRLSGRVHQVYSAVFVSHFAKMRLVTFSELSHVRFRPLTETIIDDYLAKIDPLDKAGAYAAQGFGAEIIADIEGSYSNVVGLPMEQTVRVLHDFGISPPAPKV